MKKLTPEDIKFFILEKTENEQGHFVTDAQLGQYGKIILDAIFPPLKPLTALIDAQQDCQKIFEFVHGHSYIHRLVCIDFICMTVNTGFTDTAVGHSKKSLNLFFGGKITDHYGKLMNVGNHFALVDFIRKLGYEPNPELS